MNTKKEKINQYTISILIFTITLFGGLSFFIDKSLVDSWMNYYAIFASGIAILILFFNNLEEFKFKNIKKVPLIFTLLTLFWMFVCVLFGIRINIESLKGLINFGVLLLSGFVVSNIKLSTSNKNFILYSIFLSFFLCIVIGIFQYFSGINLIQYSNALYPGILGRINSTFFIATILDKYIVLISILLAYKIIKCPESFWYKFLYLFAGIGIALTFSRGGLIAFLFVTCLLFMYSVFQKKVKSALVTIITVLAILLIPGSSYAFQSGLDYVYEKLSLPTVLRVDITFFNHIFDNVLDQFFKKESSGGSTVAPPPSQPIENQSVVFREKYKKIGKQLMKEYPIFGIGTGNYSYLYNNQNFDDYLSDTSVLNGVTTYMYPHSAYIQVAAEIGYIGLILLCLTIISYIYYIDFKKEKLLFFTVVLLIGAMLMAGYTESVFHSKQYIFVFILILGILCSKKSSASTTNISDVLKKTYSGTKQELLLELEENVKKEQKRLLILTQPKSFISVGANKSFYHTLLNQDVTVVATTHEIVKAGKQIGHCIQEQISEIDVIDSLLKYASKHKKRIYLLGLEKEDAKKMCESIQRKNSNVNIVGSGFLKNKKQIIQDIIVKEPDIVVSALGESIEKIYSDFSKFKKGLFVDMKDIGNCLNGHNHKVSKFMKNLHLDWLYDIVKNPKQWKQFYYRNKFRFLVMCEENID